MKEFSYYDHIDDDDPPCCKSCGIAMDWDGPPVSQMDCCRSCWAQVSTGMRMVLQFLACPIESGGIGVRELLEEAKQELRTTRSILEPGQN